VLALLAASATHAQWVADGLVAVANPGNPVLVGVSFDASEDCDVAHLWVAGNEDLSAIGLTVDGTGYGAAEVVEIGNGVMIVEAGYDALAAIKNGSSGTVITDQGSLTFSLKGSSAALNSAYSACLDKVRARYDALLKPLQPSQSFKAKDGVSF
jgi:hypothetical protein